jgi:hypothetical protein
LQPIYFKIKLRYLIFLPLLFFSCAQIVSPTGGSRDTKGPEVLKYEPSNNTSNFKENKIKIYFNEFINLKDVQSQLIISPPLKEIPELSAKGKTLVIPVTDTLKENTTYSFQFGNCVTDITEGNASTNLKYVFSTGPFIDSFSVVGKIINSETFEPEKDLLVMIYDSIKFSKDSFSFKFLPDYFTKTDASGAFNISNIKKGRFKIFALKDANSNYKYDSPDEKIAFNSSIFITDTLPKSFELNSFLATPSAQFIKKSNFTEFQKMDFVFNKPIDKIDFNFFNSAFSKESYTLEYGKKRDSLTLFFNKKIDLDSLNFSINENGKVLDTFYTKTISYDKVSRTRGKGTSNPFFLKIKKEEFNFLDNSGFIFSTTYPVSSIDTSKIKITCGSKFYNASVLYTDDSKRKFKLIFDWLEDSIYQVRFDSLTFKSFLPELKHDSTSIKFTVPNKSKAGGIKLKMILPGNEDSYLLLLKDSRGTTIKEVKINESTEIDFGLYLPANYKIELIEDKNRNGKWDTGNFYLDLQPEKIIKFAKDISVRANWDSEEIWEPFNNSAEKKNNTTKTK